MKKKEEYVLPVKNKKIESNIAELKNGYLNIEEIERRNMLNQTFDLTNGKELAQLYLKSDAVLSTQFFWKKYLKYQLTSLESIFFTACFSKDLLGNVM